MVGDQVPVIPFAEVDGSVGTTEPVQIGPIALNVGTILELTVTFIVVTVAH